MVAIWGVCGEFNLRRDTSFKFFLFQDRFKATGPIQAYTYQVHAFSTVINTKYHESMLHNMYVDFLVRLNSYEIHYWLWILDKTNALPLPLSYCRDHALYALSQWETTLQCNGVSHWLGAFTEWSLVLCALSWYTETRCTESRLCM